MKKGFTILELLVASLLLGMLVTILTMIFNQSSIAWRTGVSGVAAMDKVRDNVAEVREEADNLFIFGNTVNRLTGLWGSDGMLRKRACFGPNVKPKSSDDSAYEIVVLRSSVNGNTKGRNIGPVDVGSGGGGKSVQTYTVGVTSWGPDGKKDTYDDITTWPDNFEE